MAFPVEAVTFAKPKPGPASQQGRAATLGNAQASVYEVAGEAAQPARLVSRSEIRDDRRAAYEDLSS
jgi:hypothetical protein